MMNVVNFNERSCEKYRRYFDAYLDNELLVETNQDVLQHLNSCMDCTRILETRMRMKQRIKDAVNTEEAPPELISAIRGRLQQEGQSFFRRETARWMMAAAAILVMAIGGLSTLWLGWTTGFRMDSAVFQSVSSRVENILRVGLIDHVHCTILYKQWKQLVSFEEMKSSTSRSALGPEFIDLVPVVQARLGTSYKIVQGHRCSAGRRRYIHMIVKGEGDVLLSLVITPKQDESFTEADAVEVMKASGVPIYRGRQGTLEIAAFESEKYLAYVVSNLERNENLRIASDLAPAVHDHLEKLERSL